MTVPTVPNSSPAGIEDWQRQVAKAVNQLSSRLTDVGATTARPARPALAQGRWNTTTKKPEWFDAASNVWRDATGAAV